MKVALCTEILYPLYGVEKRVYEMAKHLNKYGYEVDVFTSTPQSSFNDINIKQISKPTIIKPPKRNYAFCLNYWLNIMKKLSKNNYDIIDANGHLTLFPCSLSGILSRKPVVATIHDLYLSQWSSMYSGHASAFGHFMEVFSAKLPFEKIITLNTSLKKAMIEKLGIDEEKIDIIPSGIDVNYINRINSGKKKKRIIYVNRLAPQKNISLLLRAMTKVDKSVILDVVGEGGERKTMEKLAKDLGISDRVFFHGRVEDHRKVLKMVKESEAFILPSLRESFGITVLEAMCCGTAVISTNTEGPRDRIVNGVNGFLCDFSETDMSEKINALVDDSKLRSKIEKNGKKTSMNYDWNIIVKKIAESYDGLISK